MAEPRPSENSSNASPASAGSCLFSPQRVPHVPVHGASGHSPIGPSLWPVCWELRGRPFLRRDTVFPKEGSRSSCSSIRLLFWERLFVSGNTVASFQAYERKRKMLGLRRWLCSFWLFPPNPHHADKSHICLDELVHK